MINCSYHIDNCRCQLKLILLSVIILLTITYPSVNLLQCIILYLNLHPRSFWFSLGVSILVSVASTILHCTLKNRMNPSTVAQEHYRRDSTESFISADEDEPLLTTCNRLEHKFEELCALGQKVKTAIEKGVSPRMNSEVSAFSFSKLKNQVRSSDTMTPSALDVSPIEPDMLAEATNERLLSKNINAFSSPFSQRQLKKKIELRYLFADRTPTHSIMDNRDVFEKANRHIAESDISDLSELQSSDPKVSSDSQDQSCVSSNLELEEATAEDKVENEEKITI